jgi:hypothetical protein
MLALVVNKHTVRLAAPITEKSESFAKQALRRNGRRAWSFLKPYFLSRLVALPKFVSLGLDHIRFKNFSPGFHSEISVSAQSTFPSTVKWREEIRVLQAG